MQKKPKVLFLSTGNSSRGVMAEAFLRTLAADHFEAVSVGIKSNDVHPLAGTVMDEVGIDISGQKPKSVAESVRDSFSHVVILYDSAKERSPIFPFTPHLLRWSIADPATAEGSWPEKAEAFRQVRDQIRNNIANFVNEVAKQSKPPRHEHLAPAAQNDPLAANSAPVLA